MTQPSFPDYRRFYQELKDSPLSPWRESLQTRVDAALHDRRHGKMPEWLSWLARLPALTAASVALDRDAVCIGDRSELTEAQRLALLQTLQLFHPWRKGPFSVFGIDIDTEWRSDWKWSRINTHIHPLHGRRVLDVGCGSGYHVLRMLGAGAQMAIGIDPTMLYVMQFQALKHFIPTCNAFVLPLRSEDLPQGVQAFDTVFSMGVLYHCRSPMDHLRELRGQLRTGGELVLETLVINGGPQDVLVPLQRYAKMRNVWFIPSTAALTIWLQRCGFTNVRVVDITTTTLDEQRSTEWMRFESLADFLDPDDRTKTIEGYPSPCRATLCASACD